MTNLKKGYHYTTDINYKKIQAGWLCPPLLRSGDLEKFVIFGFLNPLPESWIKNREFPEAWNELVDYLSNSAKKQGTENIVLLEIELLPTDGAEVIDRAHYERARSEERPWTTRALKAKRKYWEQRIPLQDYGGEHQLPELIIPRSIPSSRIKIYSTIPTNTLGEQLQDVA